jgi:hypothetical protein
LSCASARPSDRLRGELTLPLPRFAGSAGIEDGAGALDFDAASFQTCGAPRACRSPQMSQIE